jgi:hypothetical protein
MLRASTLCLTSLACLLATGTSRAAIIGVEPVFIGSSAFGDTYHLFAVFDEPSVLLNLFNVNWVGNSNFYQYTTPPFNPVNDVTPPNSGFFGFAPGLEFDSYVSIGDTDSADGTDIKSDPAFDMGTNTITGGWFDSNPLTADGATDINNAVFVAQLTLTGGTNIFANIARGNGSLTYRDFAGNTIQGPLPVMPTPGTSIALLAGLGLSSRRRR